MLVTVSVNPYHKITPGHAVHLLSTEAVTSHRVTGLILCIMDHRSKIGLQFERLTVIDVIKKDQKTRLACHCQCGNFVSIPILSWKNTKSCGCLSREVLLKRNTTHGMSKTSEFNIWGLIIDRCTNPKSPAYHNYGGRGISICDEWRTSFMQFLSDMGPRPSKKHEIDRIDTNGNYSPENCRWTTSLENNRNRRNNRLITFNGQTKCLEEWASIIGVNSTAISNRLRRGWSIEDALTQPASWKKLSDRFKTDKP